MMVEHGYKASEELMHRTMFALADAYHHTLRHVPLNAPGRRRLYSIGMRIAERCARVRRMIGAPQSLQEGADWLVDTFPQMLRNPTRCGVNHAQSRAAAARVRAVPFKNQCDNVECDNFEKDKAFSLCAKCRAVAYCSAACQKVDWKNGGHKAECDRLCQVKEKI